MTTPSAPKIEMLPVAALKPYPGNARRHSKKQVRQIADSIERFGFTNPVLVGDDGEIVAGHGRVMAAKELGLETVPTVRLSHLSAEERRAYVIADNKLALNAGWDTEILAIELQALIDIDFDVELTGFSLAEVDLTLDQAREASVETADNPADLVPEPSGVAVSRQGDLWHLGRHRLLCGDARSPADVARLMGQERADLIFTDPPYNVPIDGNVGGLGAIRHREFAFASGEMTPGQFTAFLKQTLGNAASGASDGAITFVCMDWRHMRELLDAAEGVFSEMKNLCVWNKSNAGMGTFYRSKHELIFVFKVGEGAHTNSFGLGETGRYRTNVWDYRGVSSLGGKRMEELAMHPTVKPVALVADAIRDCSRRGEIVLDVFGGSGSTLIAAESCGRSARLLEYDPLYCDTITRRWETYTGKRATLDGDGRAFEEIAAERVGTEAQTTAFGPPAAEGGVMANDNGKRRPNNRTGKRQSSRVSRTMAASAPSPKRKGLSQDVVDSVKRQVIFGESIGHRNPPKETRFKKGQSGNPKGRPKKTDDVGPGGKDSMTSIILREGARKISIRENDETKEITKIEAVSRAQYLLAIKKGSAYAQKHIIERYDRAQREAKRERDASIAFWTEYKETMSPLFAEAERSGEPPPDILPHPEDVVVDYDRGVRFVGPIDQEGADRVEELIRLRDVHHMQHALEERVSDDPDGPNRPGTALVIAMLIERSLPPRLRLAEGEWIMRMMRYQGTAKRKLLKDLHWAWRKVGWPRRRGFVYPPQWWGEKYLNAFFDFGAAAVNGETDLTEHVEAINAVLREWFGRKSAA